MSLYGADVLAGRKTVGQIKGTILYAGRQATNQFLQRYTGYVEQFGEPLPHQSPSDIGLAILDLLEAIWCHCSQGFAVNPSPLDCTADRCCSGVCGNPINQEASKKSSWFKAEADACIES